MPQNAHRPAGSRHHVVIIGSGFGGLFAARELADANVDVTLIAKTNHHLFQPLLYQVATGLLSPGEIAPMTRQILRQQSNIHVVEAEVTDINATERTVTGKLGTFESTWEYDSLIVAAGAGQSYFGNDQFAEFAPGLKSIDDALEIRARILGAFERAELTDDIEERERLLTFVIVGAGPTGVELAGQIAELAHRTLHKEYSNIEPSSARVVLMDAAPQVLPPFGKRLGRNAQRTLEKMDVEVLLNAMVSNVDAESVTYKDMKTEEEHTVYAKTKVWSAGVAASPLGKIVAEQLGAETDRGGRVAVNTDLSVGSDKNVFVIGDMISLNRLPGVAQVAIQTGEYVARQIAAEAEGTQTPEQRKDFEYFDKGSMATISRFNAVAKIGKAEITGFPAWIGWLVVHVSFLVGFRNKFVSSINWVLNAFTRDRTNLTTTSQQLVARTHEEFNSDER